MKKIILHLNYILLLLCYYFTALHVVAAQPQKKRRTKRRSNGALSTHQKLHKLNRSDETLLRDKWADILSLEQSSGNAVRLGTRQEEQYRYESEILADQLLGMAPIRGAGLLMNDRPLLFLPWTYSFPLAATVAICFFALPIAGIIGTFLSSLHSSITPYLLPTMSIVQSTTGNYLRQGQAVLHSFPYFLRHLNRIKIKPMQLIYKVLKKCIILECWRHIWVRVYRTTSYLWKGTKSNAHSVYVRVVPGFIRRGVKSMIQSMIQGHVHGAIGGLAGTFWESTATASSSIVEPEDVLQDVSDSLVTDSLSATATDSVQSALEATVESIAEEVVDDAIAIETAIESAVDAVVEDGLIDSIDSATLETAVEAFVEDCLDGDCVDAIVDSAMET